jgi:hypothetical protein
MQRVELLLEPFVRGFAACIRDQAIHGSEIHRIDGPEPCGY